MADVILNLVAYRAIVARKAERGIKNAVLTGERILRADLLNRAGTGRVYPRGKRSHQASAPGQPPAPDTGSLRARTGADQDIRRSGDEVVGSITANTAYAHALEVGTERVAARPYLSTLQRVEYADKIANAFFVGASK